MDKFYTSAELATSLISGVSLKKVKSVADFAAGEGALLLACQKQWPGVRVLGVDSDPAAVAFMKREFPAGKIGICNFLNARSRAASPVLREAASKVSLVALNPPFSCRGAKRHIVVLNGKPVGCSLAMAFVAQACEYVSGQGELIAILPASCLHSDKDAEILRELATKFAITKVGERGREAFDGCHTSTHLVRFTKIRAATVPRSEVIRVDENRTSSNGLIVTRGHIAMHSVVNRKRRSSVPLVHTTELRRGRVDIHARSVSARYQTVGGPCILVPRVGNPNPNKICLYNGRKPIALSDCVIAVRTENRQETFRLFGLMQGNWSYLRVLYGGTGAKYLTIDRLTQALLTLLDNRLRSVALPAVDSRAAITLPTEVNVA